MKHSESEILDRAAEWADLALDSRQIEALERYAGLLVTEGVAAGGIGPNEAERVWSRHIADSIVYGPLTSGSTWLDVGTGVGLPAVPLAICYPEMRITALDRAGRRIDVLKRWRRILGVPNLHIAADDVMSYTTRHSSLLFRGSLRLPAARKTVTRLATDIGVFGLTHGATVPDETVDENDEVVEIPASVLDSRVTLLRINP